MVFWDSLKEEKKKRNAEDEVNEGNREDKGNGEK
jgi:hypothetical protein